MPYAHAGDAINARLVADAEVASIVGDRVYPTMPTQNASKPYIVHYRITGGGGFNLEGRRSLQRYTYRVDAYANDEATAEAILKAATVALSSWSDKPNGVHVVLPDDDADTQVTEDATRVPGQSFMIWFQENLS